MSKAEVCYLVCKHDVAQVAFLGWVVPNGREVKPGSQDCRAVTVGAQSYVQRQTKFTDLSKALTMKSAAIM